MANMIDRVAVCCARIRMRNAFAQRKREWELRRSVERSADLSRWTDHELIESENDLYEREKAGEDTWGERDAVLWEINSRNR